MGALEDVVEHLDRLASSSERIEKYLDRLVEMAVAYRPAGSDLDRLASSSERIEKYLDRLVEMAAAYRPAGSATPLVSSVETGEQEMSPSTEPPPARPATNATTNTTQSLPIDANGDAMTGSAHGVSNMRFAAYAPKILRRLLRDDRTIQTGVLTSTLDQEIPIPRESRMRIVKRMLIECGFVSLSGATHGVAPYVRVTDVEAARRWLAAFDGEDERQRGSGT